MSWHRPDVKKKWLYLLLARRDILHWREGGIQFTLCRRPGQLLLILQEELAKGEEVRISGCLIVEKISGEPIIRGMSQLPKPPTKTGITRKKIIKNAWAVTMTL